MILLNELAMRFFLQHALRVYLFAIIRNMTIVCGLFNHTLVLVRYLLDLSTHLPPSRHSNKPDVID